MRKDSAFPEFSLFGGPLHRIGCRMGLVKDGTDTVRMGVVLGLFAWSVVIGLALVQGVGPKMFSLGVIGGHVRLLVAIPLFFVCETALFPRINEFVREIVNSGLVPEAELPALGAIIRRVRRLNESWLPEAVFFLLVIGLPLIGPVASLSLRLGNWGTFSEQEGGQLYGVGWYHVVCLSLFRFLLIRWLWRMGLWWCFLWRLARLDLRLVPTHPDGAGGLGYLELVQDHFSPLIVAIGAIYSASFAEAISTGKMPFEALSRLIPMVLIFVLVIILGPLFIFSKKLWLCRVNGWSDYMAMASRYVEAFDRKWVQDEQATGESQLGTGDIQSLADLGNSMNVVRGMRLVPTSNRLVVITATFVLLPMVPLLLLKYPVDQLVARLFQTLTGL